MRYLVSILILLLAAYQAFAPTRRALLLNRAAPTAFTPQSIAGMAYFWNYSDLSAGVVTTWTDEIQSANWNTAVGSVGPTNGASGVYFLGTLGALTPQMTNAPGFTIASNFTFWIVFKDDNSSSSGYKTLMTVGSSLGFWLQNPGGGKQMSFYFSAANHYYSSVLNNNEYYDTVWSNGNGYTNGVSYGTTTIKTDATTFNTIGRDAAGDYFGGYVKFIGIWTNSITGSDAANLAIWSAAH